MIHEYRNVSESLHFKVHDDMMKMDVLCLLILKSHFKRAAMIFASVIVVESVIMLF